MCLLYKIYLSKSWTKGPFAPGLEDALLGSSCCSTQSWEQGTHWAEALRKQLSSQLPFVEFKATIEVPLLRVLGKMLQFRTAGCPCCHVYPCAAAEHGSEGRNQMWGCSQ